MTILEVQGRQRGSPGRPQDAPGRLQERTGPDIKNLTTSGWLRNLPGSVLGAPLAALWVPFGRPLGVIWVPCAPLKILKILETPSAQLFGRFGVAKGSYRWPPRDPIGAPNASR